MVSLKIMIVACEDSGDGLGASLMEDLCHPKMKKFFGDQIINKYIDILSINNKSDLDGLPPNHEKIEFEFAGMGGEKMVDSGLIQIAQYDNISIIGLIEALFIVKNAYFLMKKLILFAEDYKPDLIITIDAPGFNFHLVKNLRKSKILQQNPPKYIHYVAPTVWARKPQRAIIAAKLFDHIMLIMPFEDKFFQHMSHSYVGHYLAINNKENFASISCLENKILESNNKSIQNNISTLYNNLDISNPINKIDNDCKYYKDKYITQKDIQEDVILNIFNDMNHKKCISIMIGSRKNEIKNHITIITQSIIDLVDIIFNKGNKENNQYKYNIKEIIFIFHTTFKLKNFLIKKILNYLDYNPDIHIIDFDKELNVINNNNKIKTKKVSIIIVDNAIQKKIALSYSHFAWVKSGTVTIEVAIAKVPMLTFYCLSRVTEFILKWQIKKNQFFNLINIINTIDDVDINNKSITQYNYEFISNTTSSNILIPELIGRDKFNVSNILFYTLSVLKNDDIKLQFKKVYNSALNKLVSPGKFSPAKSIIKKILDWKIF
ncbi:glycosyltransferase family protein [Lyticum sinuosum]|uniref:Lipid-A-disaccharide synthase n=1 Tax=Lyticum sinuosum TaxID=1332059 RepID=A0AAE4VL07_9RICK|nr:hypothetical protein [Lyticum sinuosum]MDZ5761309.1 Lipid-A-disaccharide synthase [Lyticum sinuosum]